MRTWLHCAAEMYGDSSGLIDAQQLPEGDNCLHAQGSAALPNSQKLVTWTSLTRFNSATSSRASSKASSAAPALDPNPSPNPKMYSFVAPGRR